MIRDIFFTEADMAGSAHEQLLPTIAAGLGVSMAILEIYFGGYRELLAADVAAGADLSTKTYFAGNIFFQKPKAPLCLRS